MSQSWKISLSRLCPWPVFLAILFSEVQAGDINSPHIDLDTLFDLKLLSVDNTGEVQIRDSPIVQTLLKRIKQTSSPQYPQEDIQQDLENIWNLLINKTSSRRKKRTIDKTNLLLGALATIAPTIFGPNNPGTLALIAFNNINNGIDPNNIPLTIFMRIIRLLLTATVGVFNIGNSGIEYSLGLASGALSLAGGLVSALAGILSGGTVLTVRGIFSSLNTIPALLDVGVSIFRRIIKIVNFFTLDIPNQGVRFTMGIMNSFAASNRFLRAVFMRKLQIIKFILTLPFRGLLPSAPSLFGKTSPSPTAANLLSLISKSFQSGGQRPPDTSSALSSLAIPSALFLANIPLLTKVFSPNASGKDEEDRHKNLYVPDFSLPQTMPESETSVMTSIKRAVQNFQSGMGDITAQIQRGFTPKRVRSPAEIIMNMGKALNKVTSQPLAVNILMSLALASALSDTGAAAEPAVAKRLIAKRLVEEPAVLERHFPNVEFMRNVRDVNVTVGKPESIPLEVFHNNTINKEFDNVPTVTLEDILNARPSSGSPPQRISSLEDLKSAFKDIIRVENYLEAFDVPDVSSIPLTGTSKSTRLWGIVERAIHTLQEKDANTLNPLGRNLTELFAWITKSETAANIDELLRNLSPFNNNASSLVSSLKNHSRLAALFSTTPGMGLFDNLRRLFPDINPLQAMGFTSLMLLKTVFTLPLINAGVMTAKFGSTVLGPPLLMRSFPFPSILDIIAPQQSILNPLSFINPLSMLRSHVERKSLLSRIQDVLNPFRILTKALELTPFGGIFRGLRRIVPDPLEMAGVTTLIGFGLLATTVGFIASVASIGGALVRLNPNSNSSLPIFPFPLLKPRTENTDFENFLKLNFATPGSLFNSSASNFLNTNFGALGSLFNSSASNPLKANFGFPGSLFNSSASNFLKENFGVPGSLFNITEKNGSSLIQNVQTILRDHPILTSLLFVKGFFLPPPLNIIGLLGLLSIILLGRNNNGAVPNPSLSGLQNPFLKDISRVSSIAAFLREKKANSTRGTTPSRETINRQQLENLMKVLNRIQEMENHSSLKNTNPDGVTSTPDSQIGSLLSQNDQKSVNPDALSLTSTTSPNEIGSNGGATHGTSASTTSPRQIESNGGAAHGISASTISPHQIESNGGAAHGISASTISPHQIESNGGAAHGISASTTSPHQIDNNGASVHSFQQSSPSIVQSTPSSLSSLLTPKATRPIKVSSATKIYPSVTNSYETNDLKVTNQTRILHSKPIVVSTATYVPFQYDKS